MRVLAQQLLDHLQHTSPSSHGLTHSDPDASATSEVMSDAVEHFDRRLHSAAQVGSDVLSTLRARTAAGDEEIKGVRTLLELVERRLEGAEKALSEKLASGGDMECEDVPNAAIAAVETVDANTSIDEDDDKRAFPGRPRGATVGSADSQATAVSSSCYTDGSTLAHSTSSFSAGAKAKLGGGPSRVSLTPSRKSRTRVKGVVTTAGGRLASWLEAMFSADSSSDENVPPVPTLPIDIIERDGREDEEEEDVFGFSRVRNSNIGGGNSNRPLRKSVSSSSMINVPPPSSSSPPPAKENRLKMWLKKRRTSEVSRSGAAGSSVHSRPSYAPMMTVSEPTSPARNSPEPVVAESSLSSVGRPSVEDHHAASLYVSRDVLVCARRDVTALYQSIELVSQRTIASKHPSLSNHVGFYGCRWTLISPKPSHIWLVRNESCATLSMLVSISFHHSLPLSFTDEFMCSYRYHRLVNPSMISSAFPSSPILTETSSQPHPH
jgi:hypothetical protein